MMPDRIWAQYDEETPDADCGPPETWSEHKDHLWGDDELPQAEYIKVSRVVEMLKVLPIESFDGSKPLVIKVSEITALIRHLEQAE